MNGHGLGHRFVADRYEHIFKAEFTIEADREHAEWNMTRPVENVATITRDELVVVALDRRFSVTSVDGLLNVQSELA